MLLGFNLFLLLLVLLLLLLLTFLCFVVCVIEIGDGAVLLSVLLVVSVAFFIVVGLVVVCVRSCCR